jgi:FtsZ-binding cell division protein ZapB
MSDDPNDAIVCLRLELHRVRDQFTMVSQVVEFERKENLRLRNEREVLILEVASLKVEVEELKGDNQQLQARCDFYEGRNQQ